MGKLFEEVTKQATLLRAWRKIRSNGIRSSLHLTQQAVEQFDKNYLTDIRRIQSRLRSNKFSFDPQTGVTKRKSSGGKRGLVMAPIHNRVVERALLDVLQSKCLFVKYVIQHPTSVGGVPERSVPHGLKLINEAFQSGATHFVRSDISGFFDHIPRKQVLALLAEEISDESFLRLLDAATTVTLANEIALGEDRGVFPTNEEGVAQGSPLSPLFGNILLYDFDLKMNGRGMTCVRFIDDFVILGNKEASVKKAYLNGNKLLTDLNLDCHDPFESERNKDKSDQGQVTQGFTFLGYYCEPGLFQPSESARKKILSTIDEHLSLARWAIKKVNREQSSFSHRQRYAQSQVLIDQVLRGWGESFAYGTSTSTIANLDEQISHKLDEFRKWYASFIKNMSWRERRRTGGVCLLQDIRLKSFDEVPFVLKKPKRIYASQQTTVISTDGSVITKGKSRNRDKGAGGWAFIDHMTDHEMSGCTAQTTIGRMEVTAVIEALRYAPKEFPIIIRTDSQYVSDTFNNGHIVKSNQDLWREIQALANDRKVKIVWTKAHHGDLQNERADRLANARAKEIFNK